ncbi:hypothetical protein Dsin_024948 [Dipteronia sinensis]|uniref:Uncharacterized protein n=1 Tax=Dipteronia sinensis TaxID=43782 RepID=A0AAE0DWN0_9ROSI|nr:hypothetical protein Dsin_024948 [Dipteronia sinensis]
MTLILRCVNVFTSPIKVEEFFITFVKMVEITRKSLFNTVKSLLGSYELDFNNVRGQGCDNGSNMKGKNNGVHSRVIREYPRAFYTPCGSTKRWEILKNHVKYCDGKGLTLKSWSDTHWESRVSSVKAIRFQVSQIKNALIHPMENNDDAATVCDAQSLAKCLKFDFLVGMIIWYEILNKVNKVSKVLQQKEMDIDDGISLLMGLITYFEEYKERGFDKAMIEAEKIAIEMEIKSKFHESRVRSKKKFFL